MSDALRTPELMSPAGGWPQLHAAVEAGADAVYFGLTHFTARAKVGFTLEELPRAIRTLHRRGVRGYVTFNTLVFDHELPDAERALQAIARSGADAIIVQDLAVARLARRVAPELEVHGSTQMSITSAQGAELAASFGCSRVVLGRELSLRDIARITAATEVEIEVFVHGALCVSYSGQCFSSEAWGGRSANRGQCAQACRLPYDLFVDGERRDLGPHRYLLSPGDLYALHQVPELARAGVHCLKIEGRYKDAEYVALVTDAYRRALDDAAAARPLGVGSDDELALETVYSRGLGPHFIAGTDHQRVVIGRAPRHRGVRVAEVVRVDSGGVLLRLERSVKRGDGVVFDAADRRSPEEREEGGKIYDVQPRGRDLAFVTFGRRDVDLARVRAGDLVWRTSDVDVERRARPFTRATDPRYTRPLDLEVVARRGEPLAVTAAAGGSERPVSCRVTGSVALEPAAKRAFDEDAVRANLGRLGGTPFHLGAVRLEVDEPLFVPVSDLNAVRRALVERLLEVREAPPVRSIHDAVDDELAAARRAPAAGSARADARLHVLVRTPAQLDAALEADPASVTLDYLELYGLKPSVERIRAAGVRARVASPRVLKPSEQNVLKFLLSLECDIVVRSGGLLHDLCALPYDGRPRLVGDFSLNAANALSANALLELGLERVTPTYDLNAEQIAGLTERVDPRRLEPILYGHLPVFHTEHCVFCRFLSTGTDHTNCGHPCESHEVALRDGSGRLHPVMADVGCRNTVFGAEAQTGARHLPRWLAAGIRDYRVEFVREDPAAVARVLHLARAGLAGDITPDALERELGAAAPSGVTEGSLFVPPDFGDLPQLL